MCGIAGFLETRPGNLPLEATARVMADAVRHRGPDDVGVWSDADAGIALGHRRLSIVDLSPAGHQPMLSDSGRYVIAFNGEIYNHAAMRADLGRLGLAPPWRGHSDTEVLLAAISAWGIEGALERSVGMFAFAVWDRTERLLILARDRLGEKPLYYGRVRGTFVFGSELSALARHPHWDGEIDRGALALLLRHNCIPAPYSIYRGIKKLPPGTYLVVRAADAVRDPKVYWSAAGIAQRGADEPFAGSPEEAVERVQSLLEQSIGDQMLADVPLGAFLSGGVDSSTVVAVMQSLSGRPIKTYSIGFHEAAYDEAPQAKAIARHLGTDHTELYCSMADALDVVPRLAGVYSEPFADSSQIPTLLVSALARKHVTVSLSGDGGDELFAGYTRYGLANRLWPYLSKTPRALRRFGSRAIRTVSPAHWDRLAHVPLQLAPERYRITRAGDKLHKAAGVLEQGTFDDLYRELVSHWPDPGAVVLGGPEPPSILTQTDHKPHFASRMREMMYLDLVSYMPDDILVKVDRAAMSVGLETRVPLLDHRLVTFALSLPPDLLHKDGQSKWPLRQVLYRYVPRALIERPKMGFGVPLDGWLRGPLREWAESLLDERRLAREGFFDPKAVRAVWHEHLSGRRNFQYRLWDVLIFQAWNEARTQASPVA